MRSRSNAMLPDTTPSSRSEHAGTPGKRTLTETLPAFQQTTISQREPGAVPAVPVQLRGGGSAESAAHVQHLAENGTRGPSGKLPYLDTIQRCFGRFDVSNVHAHTDDSAARSAQAMGAEAFATGDRVAFGSAPSLHTAAHEAAHVIQQRAGVQLKGGVGEAGDSYERHADAVADLVVAGKSAAPLLAEAGEPGTAVPASRAVQHLLQGENDENHWRRKLATANTIKQIKARELHDPSLVQVLIFSGRQGPVAELLPISTNQRQSNDVPDTAAAWIRDDHRGGARYSDQISRDGEMFQLELVDEAVARFLQKYFQHRPYQPDELRLEFLGPRGTCTDCEVALREAVAAWQTVIDRELGTGTLTLSLVARWTVPEQIEHNMRLGQSNNNNNNNNNHQHNKRDQSTTYGTTSATHSKGPTIDEDNWFPAPHWKNQIT